jgi:hypothetical protein
MRALPRARACAYARGMRALFVALSLLSFASGCYYRRAGIDSAVITNDPDAFAAPPRAVAPEAPPSEIPILGAEQVRAARFAEDDMVVTFGPEQDGTQLLLYFLSEARARGATAASDVNLVFTITRGGEPVECRVAVQPEGDFARIPLPTGSRLVALTPPVTQVVTENEQRCGDVALPSTGMVTTTEYRCSNAASPMPFRRSYQCQVVPVARPVTDKQVHAQCRTEPVTREVTRYDFELAARFVPAELDKLKGQRFKLVETKPVCYTAPAASQASTGLYRLEAKILSPQADGAAPAR